MSNLSSDLTPRLLITPFLHYPIQTFIHKGGGSAGLDNFRTLCTPCHAVETAKLRTRLKAHKAKMAAIGTKDIRACFGSSPPPEGGTTSTDGGGRGGGGE